MKFPEKPTCHGKLSPLLHTPIVWYSPGDGPNDIANRTHRSCSYCGSVHPEDLLKMLEKGARLVMADQKYGYIHKFYVRDTGNRMAVKFYTQHLLDQGYDDEALEALLKIMSDYTGLVWLKTSEGKIKYGYPLPEE